MYVMNTIFVIRWVSKGVVVGVAEFQSIYKYVIPLEYKRICGGIACDIFL